MSLPAGIHLNVPTRDYFADAMIPSIQYFLERHSDPDKCWEWHGAPDKDGYRRIKIKGKTRRAHRVIYEIVCGQIPDGLNLLHSCDNPACCNPGHLLPGTQAENCRDAMKKDRHSRGTRNGISKLTDDAVRDIRTSSLTQWELARKYNVWQGTIWQVKHRKRWTHVKD